MFDNIEIRKEEMRKKCLYKDLCTDKECYKANSLKKCINWKHK